MTATQHKPASEQAIANGRRRRIVAGQSSIFNPKGMLEIGKSGASVRESPKWGMIGKCDCYNNAAGVETLPLSIKDRLALSNVRW